ncbi:MAG: hypothetical protein M3R24_37215 [Chloroflexota bacterium]|nr:hypothetical protein [Chloroflexota bacterium]
MTTSLRLGLVALLRKAQFDQDGAVLREGVHAVSQALLKLEVTQHVDSYPISALWNVVGSAMTIEDGNWTQGNGTIATDEKSCGGCR